MTSVTASFLNYVSSPVLLLVNVCMVADFFNEWTAAFNISNCIETCKSWVYNDFDALLIPGSFFRVSGQACSLVSCFQDPIIKHISGRGRTPFSHWYTCILELLEKPAWNNGQLFLALEISLLGTAVWPIAASWTHSFSGHTLSFYGWNTEIHVSNRSILNTLVTGRQSQA